MNQGIGRLAVAKSGDQSFGFLIQFLHLESRVHDELCTAK